MLQRARVGTLAAVMAGLSLLPQAAPVAAAEFTRFEEPAFAIIEDMTPGPDGSIWYIAGSANPSPGLNEVRRRTSSGAFTAFPLPSVDCGFDTCGAAPRGITFGPDGNLWLTLRGANTIGRMTTAGVLTQFSTGLSADAGLGGITAGADGNLWFVETATNKIGRITTAGVITEFNIPTSGANSGSEGHITTGPDGNVWFVERAVNKIGRITPGGTIVEFTIPTANRSPRDIAGGSDGNVWFTEASSRIGRITPAGVITELEITTGDGSTAYIAAAPDGKLWFNAAYGDNFHSLTPPSEVDMLTIPDGNDSTNQGPLTVASDGAIWMIAFFDMHKIVPAVPEATSTTLDSSENPSTLGEAVTFTAAVSSEEIGTIEGIVTFKDGVATLGTSNVADGEAIFVTSSLTQGSHPITAEYGGSEEFAASTSAVLTQTVVHPFGPPPGFSATATSTSTAQLSWLPVADATSYEIFRSSNGAAFVSDGTTAETTYGDGGLSPNTTYLYQVRAIGPGGNSDFSATDAATTTVFTDPSLVAGQAIKAVHFTQLRTAINAMRTAAGLAEQTFTGTIAAGVTISATHLVQMRTALDQARAAIGLSALTYTNPTIVSGTTVAKTAHIVELRNGVK